MKQIRIKYVYREPDKQDNEIFLSKDFRDNLMQAILLSLSEMKILSRPQYERCEKRLATLYKRGG